MSRSRAHRDPVENRATAPMALSASNEVLAKTVANLPGRELSVVKRVFNGMALRGIATQDGVSLAEVRLDFRKGLSKLRHPSHSQPLREYYVDFDYLRLLQWVEHSALRDDQDVAPLIWCDRHGWTEQNGMPECRECPCQIPEPDDMERPGRPRLYCSSACRQRAYRRRAGSSRCNRVGAVGNETNQAVE